MSRAFSTLLAATTLGMLAGYPSEGLPRFRRGVRLCRFCGAPKSLHGRDKANPPNPTALCLGLVQYCAEGDRR